MKIEITEEEREFLEKIFFQVINDCKIERMIAYEEGKWNEAIQKLENLKEKFRPPSQMETRPL